MYGPVDIISNFVALVQGEEQSAERRTKDSVMHSITNGANYRCPSMYSKSRISQAK